MMGIRMTPLDLDGGDIPRDRSSGGSPVGCIGEVREAGGHHKRMEELEFWTGVPMTSLLGDFSLHLRFRCLLSVPSSLLGVPAPVPSIYEPLCESLTANFHTWVDGLQQALVHGKWICIPFPHVLAIIWELCLLLLGTFTCPR